MSGLLLDTNAFAMTLTDDPRLAATARDRISTTVRAVLSAISFYEIGQKVRLGKWPEMAPHVAGLAERARTDGFEVLPLSPAAALAASVMEWDHRDPFDRMIATVSIQEKLPLVSSDAVFDELRISRIWN